ncbi:MAG: RidA family protein, partial [SAR324 cluster bacterium]|nr:RidA family protein [SAR324 cluster bacterium]
MSEIKRFQVGERMSQAVVHGDTVYTAGQVAQSAPGASVADQTRAILSQIDDLLREAGTDKSRLISATIWLSDISTFNEMNEIWDAWVV